MKTETSENASFSMETPKMESFKNATTTIYTTSSVSKRVQTKEMKTKENGVMQTPPFSHQALFCALGENGVMEKLQDHPKTERYENGDI